MQFQLSSCFKKKGERKERKGVKSGVFTLPVGSVSIYMYIKHTGLKTLCISFNISIVTPGYLLRGFYYSSSLELLAQSEQPGCAVGHSGQKQGTEPENPGDWREVRKKRDLHTATGKFNLAEPKHRLWSARWEHGWMVRSKYLSGTLLGDTGNKLSLNNKKHPWHCLKEIASNFIQTQLTCSAPINSQAVLVKDCTRQLSFYPQSCSRFLPQTNAASFFPRKSDAGAGSDVIPEFDGNIQKKGFVLLPGEVKPS